MVKILKNSFKYSNPMLIFNFKLQSLASLEEKIDPGQLDSDKDRLLLIQEKEQLLRELRSISPRSRTREEMTEVKAKKNASRYTNLLFFRCCSYSNFWDNKCGKWTFECGQNICIHALSQFWIWSSAPTDSWILDSRKIQRCALKLVTSLVNVRL